MRPSVYRDIFNCVATKYLQYYLNWSLLKSRTQPVKYQHLQVMPLLQIAHAEGEQKLLNMLIRTQLNPITKIVNFVKNKSQGN